MIKFTGLIALVAFSGVASADAVPKEVAARYEGVKAALTKLEFKAFSSFFAKDFVSVDPAGKSSTRAEFLAMVKPMFDSATKGEPKEILKGAKIHDGVVSVSFDLTLKLIGKGGVQTIHEVGVDSWKKINGKYYMVKTVDSKFDVTTGKVRATKAKSKDRGKGQ